MTTYQDIHWASVNFLKNHLYSRLASPLNNTLGRVAIARHVDNPDDVQQQFDRAEHSLELTLNLVKAWAALVHVKSGGMIRNYRRQQVKPDEFPDWLMVYLKAHTAVHFKHEQTLFVHPETFYESLILICKIGRAAGNLKYLRLSDSTGEHSGVWLRAVFEPPEKPYAGLKGILKQLNVDSPLELDTVIQIHVASDLLRLNGARLTLQTNTQTGEQALAARVPVASKEPQSPMVRVPVDEALLPPEDRTAKNVYHLAGQLADQMSDRKREVFALAQQIMEEADKKAVVENPDEQPAEQKPTVYSANETAFDALDMIRGTISDPVLADSHAPESTPPDKAEAAQPSPATGALDAIEVVENQPDTLILPPRTLEQRLVTPPPHKPAEPANKNGTDDQQSAQDEEESPSNAG